MYNQAVQYFSFCFLIVLFSKVILELKLTSFFALESFLLGKECSSQMLYSDSKESNNILNFLIKVTNHLQIPVKFNILKLFSLPITILE